MTSLDEALRQAVSTAVRETVRETLCAELRAQLASAIESALSTRDARRTTPDTMTPADVAIALHISKRTVWRMIRSAKLRAAKIGRRYVVSAVEVQAYIDSAASPAHAHLDVGAEARQVLAMLDARRSEKKR